MAMDAKDLRIESALGAHSDDGNTKYAQSAAAFQTNGNKPYHDIGSNSLAKMDAQIARPCAIIGPDRVVPPQSTNDAYVKKVPVEPWPCADSVYQHPPDYPLKPEYQLSRNISPRQTFQENMQRIMVPPSYTSMENSEDPCLKNPKLMPLESKFCDVPYTISPINNEPKVVKNSDGHVLNNNPNQPILPHGWVSGVNVRPLRPYGAPDLYQYSEYSNCPGPRPISMIRPHRNAHEDVPQVYQDRHHEANIRFKPYPTKERLHQNPHPHARYDYIPNYPNAFQPHASYPPHKYELQKSIPAHSYSVYPPVPLKYLEKRMPVPAMEKYPRSNPQINFNQPYCNQNIPSTYGTLPGTYLQNRAYPYAPDLPTKNMIQNRLYFDSNNARKYYSTPENMFLNDINRPPTIKSDLMYPSYPSMNIQSLPPHHIYRKENTMKGYEHPIHYRNIEYAANINPLGRLPLQFSPQTMSISPADSNTSNDTTQILGNAQEDCGYASQSSTTSIRSIESGVNRLSNEIYRRHDMTLPHINNFSQKQDASTNSKDKKGLNVRQFLQMWNEGDDESNNDSNKEATKQRDSINPLPRYESGNSEEQLYVLGLVNVPKEELGKYEHIQKISKLPENIKGYNSIELLNQYEKLVESPALNNFSIPPSQPKQKEIHVPVRNNYPIHGMEGSSTNARPLSPLDVEAKISQSVIHKEVGCNFEIRPCSPQMMNIELATPIHSVLGERLIEKVVNPVKIKSPICQRIEDTNNNSPSRSSPKVPSCKMVNNQYSSPLVNDSLKANYSLHDLESNSGVCLASLPRLDNDIELNFPEINQQFINDNKISSIRDLPILDIENGTNDKSKNKIPNQLFTTELLNSGSDSEKDVSKLSKYRKQKRTSVPSNSNDTTNVSQHRTDSVIIKNPENSKSQDEFGNNILAININMPDVDNTMDSINAVENDIAINYSDKNDSQTNNENGNDCQSMDCDTAIDFSINKCDDIQNNSINDLTKLDDSLQNNIDVDKSMCINNDTIINNVEESKKLKEIPNKIDENSPILTPTSSTLENFIGSNELNSDAELQSVDVKQSLHETVITHSKSNDIVSDLSTLSEELLPHDDLPSLINDEHVSSNLTECNSNTPQDITGLDNVRENQTVNFSLTEHPDEEITPMCELKLNLLVENQNDLDISKDMDVKDNSCSQQEEFKSSSPEDITKSDHVSLVKTNTDAKNTFDDFVVNKIEDSIFQALPVESNSENMANKMINNINALCNLKRGTEQPSNVIEFKNDESVDILKKCNEKYLMEEEFAKVINEDYKKSPNRNNSTSISKNDLPSTHILSPEVDSFKNEYLLPNTKTEDISVDVQNMFEITPTLVNGNPNAEINKDDAGTYVSKYKLNFKKKLFSPWIQNLLLYNEGLCTLITSYRNESMEKVKQHYDENIVDQESEKSERHNGNINDEVTTSKEIPDILTELVENGTALNVKKHYDLNDNSNAINVDKIQQNDIITNDVQIKIHADNLDMKSYDSKYLPGVAEEKTKDIVKENKMDNNDKTNSDKEKNPEQLIWNQLPNRCNNRTLKRSLSESAVTEYSSIATDMKRYSDNNFNHGSKRPKISDSDILVESQVLSENLTNFIQNNRRNSISTFYNDENVSFCILIDNDCVLTEENESCQKICYSEISDECLTTICTDGDALNSELPEDISYENAAAICSEEEAVNSELNAEVYYEDNALISDKVDDIISEFDSENITYEESEQYSCESDLILQNMEDTAIEESWVEDVACIETVFSDDIAEDIIISAPLSPKDSESSDDESCNTNFEYNVDGNEHTNKVKHIYGNRMCDDDAELVEKLYRTPQMNVNKTLIDRESQLSQEYNRYYDNESLEKILSESNTLDTYSLIQNDLVSDKSLVLPNTVTIDDVHGNKENLQDLFPKQESKSEIYSTMNLPDLVQTNVAEEEKSKQFNDTLVHSCEPSCDNFVPYKKEEKMRYTISSSPEVSSTTSEEKGPAILLKIRSYKGSKISEVNEMSAGFNHTHSQRPLITKAAQKYIPPLKETIHDLKVQLRLPKQSLYKLQQLKKSKEKPKIDTNCNKLYIKKFPQDSPRKAKPKPKFEDVLMSIDEIQFKKHKTKIKKNKQSVPKVIIKKNENGAHYASTQSKETFNPDLTGRKWQPWVFLEKSNFVDKMALKQKFKAIYSHRKKTFVLAENFRKYKSISNSKFVISHPKSNDNISSGKLKYTFRLKHS